MYRIVLEVSVSGIITLHTTWGGLDQSSCQTSSREEIQKVQGYVDLWTKLEEFTQLRILGQLVNVAQYIRGFVYLCLQNIGTCMLTISFHLEVVRCTCKSCLLTTDSSFKVLLSTRKKSRQSAEYIFSAALTIVATSLWPSLTPCSICALI